MLRDPLPKVLLPMAGCVQPPSLLERMLKSSDVHTSNGGAHKILETLRVMQEQGKEKLMVCLKFTCHWLANTDWAGWLSWVMHLSICCPTLSLLGCIGDLPGDLTQDFPPGVGNLTVKSLMLPRGSIEMYTGFDTLARPLWGEFDIGLCQIPTIPPMLPGRGRVGQHIDRCISHWLVGRSLTGRKSPG